MLFNISIYAPKILYIVRMIVYRLCIHIALATKVAKKRVAERDTMDPKNIKGKAMILPRDKRQGKPYFE